jgi:hypothetical protein
MSAILRSVAQPFLAVLLGSHVAPCLQAGIFSWDVVPAIGGRSSSFDISACSDGLQIRAFSPRLTSAMRDESVVAFILRAPASGHIISH